MTPEARERYSRQIRFESLGDAGQERWLAARVVIVGCGALGSFQAGALARAGIGYLVLVDRDYVELSNLQRQWLFEESDVEAALPKAVAAAGHLAQVNRDCRVEPVVADLTPLNVDDVLAGADLILDGTDNFETRFLLNDYCVREGLPWIYGAAVGSYGIAMPIVPGVTSCFRCVYPSAPFGVQPTCETAGVLNSITSLVASWQVGLACRLLAGALVEPVISTFDSWTGKLRQIAQPDRDPECVSCGLRQFTHLDPASRAPISLCGRNAVQIHERARPLDLAELSSRLEGTGEVRRNEFALRFFVAPFEMTVFPDGRAIIKGTTDPGVARGLYAKYIGA